MRKRIAIVITIVITIMMLCPSAFSEPAFAGAWANVLNLDDSVTEITVLRLFPDHVAFYFRQQLTENSIGEWDKMLCRWEQDGDITFSLIGPAGETMGRYGLLNDKRLLSGDRSFVRFDFFVRETLAPEPEPSPAPLNSLETGYLLDPGQYIVGEDLPAGNYRFEYYENPTDIFVHKNPDSSLWSAYASVTKKSPVYAKLNLPEGSRLDIVAFPVIIMYAKPLNLGDT